MAVLLLQGPLGPFFQIFAKGLKKQGQDVHKVNFNGGDRLFYNFDGSVHNFTGAPDEWPAYLKNIIDKYNIQSVFVYGDCRHYHSEAKKVCKDLSVRYFAFEEGYLRPNFITLEEDGVNGHSPIRHESVGVYEPVHKSPTEKEIGNNFARRGFIASAYYIVGTLAYFKYRHYKHHRSFSPFYEAFCWVRSGVRKKIYQWVERSLLDPVKDKPYFLVPLQVYNDAQLIHHSPFASIEDFLKEVMTSFAESGSHAKLVIKHHPMDRGHRHYGSTIKKLAKRLGLVSQVIYIHDHHIPTLLKNCQGLVTINSTTALQAFYHGVPVKVMGDAFFDMPGLTNQISLKKFWLKQAPVDQEFADQFRAYLEDHGQINGSFYSKWPLTICYLIAYMDKKGMLERELPSVQSAPQPAV